MIVMIIAIKY